MPEIIYTMAFVDDAASAEPGLEERSFWVTASTDSLDLHGTRIDQSSWDFRRYQSNPVVLWNHDPEELPIGTVSKLETSGDKLRALITLATEEINPLAERIFRLVKAKILRGVSVGLSAGSYRWELYKEREIMVLSDCELIEISLCSTPSNGDSLAEIRNRTPKKVQRMPVIDTSAVGDTVVSTTGTSGTSAEAQELQALRLEVAASRRALEERERAEREALERSSAEMRARLDSMERAAVLDEARRSSRLTPAIEASAEFRALTASLGIAQLRSVLAVLPVSLPVGAPATQVAEPATLTQEEERFAASMGISRDELVEFKRSHGGAGV